MSKPRQIVSIDSRLPSAELYKWLQRQKQDNPLGALAGSVNGEQELDNPAGYIQRRAPLWAGDKFMIQGTGPGRPLWSERNKYGSHLPGLTMGDGMGGQRPRTGPAEAARQAWYGSGTQPESSMSYRLGSWARRFADRQSKPGAHFADRGTLPGVLQGAAVGAPLAAGMNWLRNFITGDEGGYTMPMLMGAGAGGALGGTRGHYASQPRP